MRIRSMVSWSGMRHRAFAGVLVLAVSVSASACALDEVETSVETSALSSSNGIGENGLTTNGVWNNGVWNNGVWNNGVWNNGVWNNGVWNNGVWNNGVWNNGVWNNGVWNNNLALHDVLRDNPHTAKVLQYLYSCAMPPGAHKTLDAGSGVVVELDGAIGLWPTWALSESTCEGSCRTSVDAWTALMPSVPPDSCDESCQRWLSACLLARTNAYGVKVDISMRAPETAPLAIQNALAVDDSNCPGPDCELTKYPLREGAFYGNLFATTPPPEGTDGPLVNTPSFYACAGPGSNIPEITKRFCSSQGNNGPIKVPGVCEDACVGDVCYTSTDPTNRGTRYPEVITVYLKDLIEVCGNAVCEAREDATDSCPSDCHPGAWAHSFAGTNIVSAVSRQEPAFPSGRRSSVVAPDDSIVMAGIARQTTEVDLGGPLVGSVGPNDHYIVLTKYTPDGAFVWGKRIPLIASHGAIAYAEIGGVAIGRDGSLAVSATAWNTDGPRTVVTRLTADGAPLWSKSSIGSSTSPFARVHHSTEDVLAVDPAGNVIVGGTYVALLQFEGDPVVDAPESGAACSNALDDDGDGAVDDGCVLALPSGPNGASAFFFKLSANVGSPMWGVAFNRPNERASAVTTDPAGNVILAMNDSGSTSRGLIKLSGQNGTQQWERKGRHEAVITDDEGNVYGTGGYQVLNTSYEFNLGVSLRENFFIAKYAASDGALIKVVAVKRICDLANHPGSLCNGTSFGYDIARDRAGNVLVGIWGGMSDPGPSLDFGAGPFVTYGTGDVFVVSYAPDLAFRWTKHIPMVLDGMNRGLSVDSTGRVVMSGTYAGSMVVDDRLLVNDNPQDPLNGNSFLASISAPPPGDVIAPVTDHVPESFVLEATSAQGADGWYMPPTAIDTGNAGTSVSCVPEANSKFPIGTPTKPSTTVTCWARDPLNNTPPLPSTFTVTVVDRTVPAFKSIPAPVTAEATGPSGATVSFALPTAQDLVSGVRQVTCSPAPGSVFPIAMTSVVCAATDAAGNRSEAEVSIRVVDTTPPVLTVPASPLASGDAVVTYEATAIDTVDGDVAVHCSPTSGSSFPAGTTIVACSATDASGNQSTASFSVDVPTIRIDVTPPHLILPGDLMVEATGPQGAAVTFEASAWDEVDGAVGAFCFLPSGSTFSVGSTLVNCTASDAAGNDAAASFTIHVLDTTPPLVAAPPPLVVEATSATGASVTFSASATDVVDGALAPECTPPSGSTFSIGTSLGSCRATDAAGNSATGTFTISVVDTTAPVVTAADVTVEATSGSGASASFTASASDRVDGVLTTSCSATSGTVFALGTTPVTCTATDAAGNSASASFAIHVVDTTAPTLTVPSPITVTATSASGAPVTYSVSATDTVAGSIVPTCSRASGSTFAPGTTTVTCTASDGHGNQTSRSFSIQVLYAWSGVLQPVNADGSSIFKLGQTIPMKFDLTGASSGVTDAVATLTLSKMSGSVVGSEVESVSTSAADTGNTFRFADGRYHYNLSTTNLSVGTWLLRINLADGGSRTVLISLRK